MEEFLNVLKMQLMTRITPNRVDEQMQLYQNYMKDEIAAGKTQEEILQVLGDPAKVAELVAEQYEKDDELLRAAQEEKREKEEKRLQDMTPEELNENIHNPEHGFKAEFVPDQGWDVRLGKLKLNTWYGKLLIIVIVLAIFILYHELTH